MNDDKIKDNLIVKLSFEFALEVVKYVELLEGKGNSLLQISY